MWKYSKGTWLSDLDFPHYIGHIYEYIYLWWVFLYRGQSAAVGMNYRAGNMQGKQCLTCGRNWTKYLHLSLRESRRARKSFVGFMGIIKVINWYMCGCVCATVCVCACVWARLIGEQQTNMHYTRKRCNFCNFSASASVFHKTPIRSIPSVCCDFPSSPLTRLSLES